MKIFSKWIIPIFLITQGHAFTLNTTNGSSYGVDEIVVDLADNCQNLGITNAKLSLLLEEALDQYWNNIPVSSLKMKFGGIVSVSAAFYDEPQCSSYTGVNCNINPNLIYMSAQVLVSCNDEYTQSGGASNINGFSNAGILGSTINNNIVGDEIQSSIFLINDISGNSFNSLTDNDKRAVLAHELGHAIGLGHSQVQEALMWYSRLPNRHALGWDDVDGATYLYPANQPFGCLSTDHSQLPSFTLGLLLTIFGIFIFRRSREAQI